MGKTRELRAPHDDTLSALIPLIPVFLSYVLSFIYVGIYWNNHHHMLHTCTTVPSLISCCSSPSFACKAESRR